MNSPEILTEEHNESRSREELIEEIRDLKSRFSGLERAVARLYEDRKQLQRTGALNKDPDEGKDTY